MCTWNYSGCNDILVLSLVWTHPKTDITSRHSPSQKNFQPSGCPLCPLCRIHKLFLSLSPLTHTPIHVQSTIEDFLILKAFSHIGQTESLGKLSPPSPCTHANQDTKLWFNPKLKTWLVEKKQFLALEILYQAPCSRGKNRDSTKLKANLHLYLSQGFAMLSGCRPQVGFPNHSADY